MWADAAPRTRFRTVSDRAATSKLCRSAEPPRRGSPAATTANRSRWSSHAHDDFAEGPALAHPGQGLGHLVKGEGAVDVDDEVTRDAQIGHRYEMRRPFLD